MRVRVILALVLMMVGVAAFYPVQADAAKDPTWRKTYENLDNYGTGARKSGGTSMRIPAKDILVPGKLIRFKVLSGEFKYVMVHARYDGGIWKSLLKFTDEKGGIASKELIQGVKGLNRGNPTDIIFSINGQHENFDKTPAKAELYLIDIKERKKFLRQAKNKDKKQETKKGKVKHLGCYKDTGTRDLDGYFTESSEMKPSVCIKECREKGFKYAGLQYSGQCFCGNSYGKYGKADTCNMKCSGNPKAICGGSWAQNIYQVK